MRDAIPISGAGSPIREAIGRPPTSGLVFPGFAMGSATAAFGAGRLAKISSSSASVGGESPVKVTFRPDCGSVTRYLGI
jgi:hypothetical protein